MSNVSTKKVFIKIESAEQQQEHIRNQRKTLKVLQSAATDKENFAGRHQIDSLSRLKATVVDTTVDHSKRKKVETRSIETQTSPKKEPKEEKYAITAEDLSSDAKPGEGYFERLAEKRREALEITLTENRSLHERIESLEEELETSRKQLDETRSLVELLTEMLKENEGEDEEQQPVENDNFNDDDSETRSSIEATAETEELAVVLEENECEDEEQQPVENDNFNDDDSKTPSSIEATAETEESAKDSK